MKIIPASPQIRLGCALALSLSLLTTAAYGKTPACQKDNQQEAVHYVLELKNKADAILKKNDTPLAGLKAHVLANVEFDPLAKFALGRFWNRATPEQRTEYRSLFKQTVLHTLASQVLQFRAAKLEIVRQYAAASGDVLVTSKVISPNDKTNVIGWRIAFKECRPLAIDLLKNGVSMITTKRHEFEAVVSRQGINGLISMMKSQAQRQGRQVDASRPGDRDMREILNRLFLEAAEKLKGSNLVERSRSQRSAAARFTGNFR